MAAHLGITERTVKAHISSLYRKLGVENRAQMAMLACRLGVARRSACSANRPLAPSPSGRGGAGRERRRGPTGAPSPGLQRALPSSARAVSAARVARQLHDEGGALARGALHADAAAVRLHQLPHDVEPQAEARLRLAALRALEAAEDARAAPRRAMPGPWSRTPSRAVPRARSSRTSPAGRRRT